MVHNALGATDKMSEAATARGAEAMPAAVGGSLSEGASP